MRQLVTYFFLAYLISWCMWLPLYGPSLGLPALPVLPFNHALGAYGPMIAAFIVSENRFGLLRRMFDWRHLTYMSIALFSPFILGAVCMIVASFINKTPTGLSLLTKSSEFPYWSAAAVFIYNFVSFGIGEETGWRGMALPILQKKYTALNASIILTVFWALWHLPLFLYRPGYVNMGFGGVVGWVFSLLTGSILLTWLFNSSKGSVLVCAIFHATIDIVFTAPFRDAYLVSIIGALVTLWGIATVMVFKSRNLSSLTKIQSQ